MRPSYGKRYDPVAPRAEELTDGVKFRTGRASMRDINRRRRVCLPAQSTRYCQGHRTSLSKVIDRICAAPDRPLRGLLLSHAR
jgi:hypothetical protein